MRINIKGNDITPEKIAGALAACQRDYGLKIKGATIYVRFERDDGSGKTVEPLQDGQEISRDFSFWRPKEPVRKGPKPITAPMSDQVSPAVPEDLISARDMIELCQRKAMRCMSGREMETLVSYERQNMSRPMFEKALEQMMERAGRFNFHTLDRIIYQKQRGY